MKKLLEDIYKKDFLTHLLVAFIGIGLTGKLFMAITSSLNSDSVVPGLEAMEIFRHGNVFLKDFFFSANYSALFTDLIPFYLIPQWLTNYSPLALKLTSFAIYVLVLLVFSLVIYRLTKDRTKALIFAAVFSNLAPLASANFTQPVSHVTTLIFCGVIFYLLLDLQKMGVYKKIALAAAVFLLTLSDNMFLVLLPLSFMIAYILLLASQKKITFAGIAVPFLCVLFPATAAYEIIPMIPSFVQRPIVFYPALMPAGLSLHFFNTRGMSYVVELSRIVSDDLSSFAAGLITIRGLISLAFVALFLYAAWNLFKNTKKDNFEMRLFLLFLIISNVLLFLAFEVTNVDTAPRYLIFTALSAFVAIGLGYDGSKLYAALLSLVVITGAIGCAVYIVALDHDANREQYGLIGCLEENHVDNGFAGFWDANVITYLSNEKVKVRAINYDNSSISPYWWLSDKGWYANLPDSNSIIYNMQNDGKDNGNLGQWHDDVDATPALQYGNYSVYIIRVR